MTTAATAPNHHAHHPGFAGATGLLAGLVMSIGGGRKARLAADLAAVGTGDHVIDVGCGPGRAAREAVRRGATVVGVDPAPVMLSLARAWSRRTARLSWRAGTAEELPVPDDSATVVWSLSTVHHWHDVQAGLLEVRRVLRPDGRFVAIERRSQPGARGLASHGWTDEQAATFADLCGDAGFTDVRTGTHSENRDTRISVCARLPVRS